MGSKNEKSCEKCLLISHSLFYHMPAGREKRRADSSTSPLGSADHRKGPLYFSFSSEGITSEPVAGSHTHRRKGGDTAAFSPEGAAECKNPLRP